MLYWRSQNSGNSIAGLGFYIPRQYIFHCTMVEPHYDIYIKCKRHRRYKIGGCPTIMEELCLNLRKRDSVNE